MLCAAASLPGFGLLERHFVGRQLGSDRGKKIIATPGPWLERGELGAQCVRFTGMVPLGETHTQGWKN